MDSVLIYSVDRWVYIYSMECILWIDSGQVIVYMYRVRYFRGRSLRKYIHVQHEGGTIPCTVKTMRQLSCTDRS